MHSIGIVVSGCVCVCMFVYVSYIIAIYVSKQKVKILLCLYYRLMFVRWLFMFSVEVSCIRLCMGYSVSHSLQIAEVFQLLQLHAFINSDKFLPT